MFGGGGGAREEKGRRWPREAVGRDEGLSASVRKGWVRSAFVFKLYMVAFGDGRVNV